MTPERSFRALIWQVHVRFQPLGTVRTLDLIAGESRALQQHGDRSSPPQQQSVRHRSVAPAHQLFPLKFLPRFCNGQFPGKCHSPQQPLLPWNEHLGAGRGLLPAVGTREHTWSVPTLLSSVLTTFLHQTFPEKHNWVTHLKKWYG